MTQPPFVIIIILNWNGWKDTHACVESCRKLIWPRFRIVIVDNGSTDGSEEFFRRELADVEIVQTGANLGFAGGNNVGIRMALEWAADYIWLLNNDTTVAPDALEELARCLENNPTAAMAGSKIYYHDSPRAIWFAGGAWKKGCLKLRSRGAGEIDSGQYNIQEPVGSLTGCSLMARTAAIRSIGLLDEGYFLYSEDADWCARALEQGHTLFFVPTSLVWHKVSGSIGKRSMLQYYYHFRNGLYFLSHHDRLSLPRFLLFSLLDALASLLKGNYQVMLGMLRGGCDFLRGKRGEMGRQTQDDGQFPRHNHSTLSP